MATDYDRIAEQIGEALAVLTGNTHEPPALSNSDSVTVTKDGWITTVVRLQRLRDWAEGLAETHRQRGDYKYDELIGDELEASTF